MPITALHHSPSSHGSANRNGVSAMRETVIALGSVQNVSAMTPPRLGVFSAEICMVLLVVGENALHVAARLLVRRDALELRDPLWTGVVRRERELDLAREAIDHRAQIPGPPIDGLPRVQRVLHPALPRSVRP